MFSYNYHIPSAFELWWYNDSNLFVSHPPLFYGVQTPGGRLTAQEMRNVPWTQSHWKSPFSPEHHTIHWANTPQLFSPGSFNLHHPAAGEKLSIHRHDCSHDPFCSCDLQSWWKHSFGLVAATARPLNGTDLIIWILIILSLFQRQEVILVGLWALISRKLVLQDRLWTLSTFRKGLGHICSFKHISMAQWSHWELVSSRLGQDQRNFWKAVVMEKDVPEQGTSARAHHFTAVCGWTGCSPCRVLPEGMQQPQTAGNVGMHVCKWITAVTAQKCSWRAQRHRSHQTSSFAPKHLKWGAGVNRLTCANKFGCGETPSCSHWQNSLWLLSGGPSTPQPLYCWSRTTAGQNQLPGSWPELSAAPSDSE